MRGTGEHIPPFQFQIMPEDNTSSYVMEQVRVWENNNQAFIHPEVAREIAAWWQGPGQKDYPFTAFQSTGTIVEGFGAEIERTIALLEKDLNRPIPIVDSGETKSSLSALRALLAYVEACNG